MATRSYDFLSHSQNLGLMTEQDLSAQLENLENFLFDPVARRDVTSVSDLLADEFREFGSSGRIYTKLDILAELAIEHPVTITLSDFTCQLVSPTTALVTYKSLSSHENRVPTQALRSSVWVLRSRPAQFPRDPGSEPQWQMLFHHGTKF